MAAKVFYLEGLFFLLNFKQNSLSLVQKKESLTFKAQYALFYG